MNKHIPAPTWFRGRLSTKNAPNPKIGGTVGRGQTRTNKNGEPDPPFGSGNGGCGCLRRVDFSETLPPWLVCGASGTAHHRRCRRALRPGRHRGIGCGRTGLGARPAPERETGAAGAPRGRAARLRNAKRCLLAIFCPCPEIVTRPVSTRSQRPGVLDHAPQHPAPCHVKIIGMQRVCAKPWQREELPVVVRHRVTFHTQVL